MVLAKTATTAEPPPPSSGPRISFSADLSSSDSDGDFICINPNNLKAEKDKTSVKATDFEFLSNKQTMLSADELFSEGKLLPFWQINHFSEKLQNITLKTKPDKQDKEKVEEEEEEDHKVVREEIVNKEHENNNNNSNNNRGSWFLDDDPSPRPPKCTVLWKELLRLKKQRTNTSSTRATSLSPSSSSSSTSSSSSSIGDAVKKEEREKEGKRGKKVLERTRSVTMRIRPMIHVPAVAPSKSSASLPPLFPLRFQKNRVEKRT